MTGRASSSLRAVPYAAVIGSPIGHSLSPVIHQYWMAQNGIDARYDALEIAPGSLAQWVRDAAGAGCIGFNVTLPHKIAMMELCHTLDEDARMAGAVNTVVRGKEGHWHGCNTDCFGFLQNLNDAQPGWRGVVDGPVLLFGAGGAARAAACALLRDEDDCDIWVCNRSQDRAAALVQDLRAQFGDRVRMVDWAGRHDAVATAGMVVNTTSAGMAGQADLDIDLSVARTGTIVYDIVYRPQETALLRHAAQHGLRRVSGLGMLLHQARPAFAAWFGVLPVVDAGLWDKISAVLGPDEIGLPGKESRK